MSYLKFFSPGLLVITATFGVACTQHESNQKPPPKNYKVVKQGSDEALADTTCFINVQGRDTIQVSLYINKGDVTGNMISIPYEKDRRKGKIVATKQDELITGKWMFMQEGMTDTLPVKFKLNNNTLYQQPWKADANSGRETLDTKAPFSILYQKTDCLKAMQ